MSGKRDRTGDSQEGAAFLQKLNEHALLLRVLVAVVAHGIADLLARKPCTAVELANETGLHAPTLHRLLRFLCAHGFVQQDSAGRFELAPRGQCLRQDRNDTVVDRLRRPWQDLLWRSYERLPDILQGGPTAFEQVYGRPFFDHLGGNPMLNAMFDRAMARVSATENVLIARHYAFGTSACVVDVGGGRGGLIDAILREHAGVRGILFDQPQVIAMADPELGVRHADRLNPVSGDFFKAIPGGGDVYLLKRILHDWDDDRAVAILKSCRTAMQGDARVLVVEAVMSSGTAPDPASFMDVNMMVLTGGRERTGDEFGALCAAAGLRVLGVKALPMPATLSVLEAAVV